MRKRKSLNVSLSNWLHEWCIQQKQGGIVISRIIEKALIKQYHLAPPDIEGIKKRIEKNAGK